jgi:sigma-B regulation protein RsbU (phosphoserine phosphatase)
MSASDPIRPGPTDPGDVSEARHSPHRRFRLRVHIATLFVALIAAAGLAIVAYGYRATSRLLLSAGDEEFLHVAEHTADQVRNLLAPARLLVELLARHPMTQTTALAPRLEALPLLTTALVTHPEISAVYVGFGNGDFFLVRSLRAPLRQSLNAPAGASFLVQSLAATDRPTPGRYLFLDGQLAVIQDEPRPAYRFDPRTREWYRQAMSSATLIRTNPYVFFTTREIGTTLARRSGIDPTVVGADITLQDLSRHLAQSRVTPSAQIALVDRLGFVIAHPNPERLVRPGPGDPTLTRIDDLEDPALKQLLARPGDATRGHMTLSVQGRAWIGGRRSIEVDIGEPLTLVLAAPRDELVAEARGLAQWQLLIGLGILGLTLGLVWLSARRISRPLEMLARSVERIGGGDLDTALPEVWNPLEVGALRDVTDRMRRMLRGHIEERAARLAEEQRRARELDIARQIQQSMLPTAPSEPLAGCYAIAATLQPAREVGGDLYDFFLLDGRRLILAIADVADKGMPAALLMARVTGLLRAIGRGDTGPDEVLQELDMRLSQGNDMCMFVTMACAVLDGESGELRYSSAGHERPLLRRLGGGTTVLVLEGGAALGLGAGAGFPVWTGHLAPGDTLVLCTDGVTEAFDRAGTAFGLERFQRVVAETPAEALATLPDRLVEAVERFSVGGAPRDDLAMLALQYRPPGVTMDTREGESWTFSVGSERETAARAWQWIETILRARDVPPPTVHDCVLAVEELLTNVVTHAYRGQPGHQAHIGLRLLPEKIEIRLEDAGPPFNPLEAPAPDLEAPLADRPIGGLGLLLVSRLVDRWEYAREGEANIVTLHWGRPADSLEGAAFEVAMPPAPGGSHALDIEIGSPGPTERWAALRGRLDSGTAPELEAELGPLLDRPGITSLVFRLDGLEYISSAGIRCVIRARKVIEGRGGRVALVNAQAAVLKVFQIVKALPADQIFASQAELDASLATAERGARPC